MVKLNEGFRPEDRHQSATSPDEFEQAADILEAGGTLEQAIAMLTPQHLTTLFHVEHRPPQAILRDRSKKEQIELLRGEAEKLADPT